MNYSINEKMPDRLQRIVFSRKLLIFAVFTLVVASGMTASLLITPKYEATMSLLISRNRADAQISAGEKTPDVLPNEISDEEFNSELELIKNGEVIAGAIEDLDLKNNRAPSASGNLRHRVKLAIYDVIGKTENSADEFAPDKMMLRVMNNLDVEPIKKSRIIKVSYTDTDAARAKQTLEKIYERYVALHNRLNEKPATTAVFGEQSDEFERKLNAATEALKRFDQTNGVTGAESGVQNELLLKQLSAAESQADQTRTEIAETEQRIRVLKEKIAAQPENLQTGSTSKYVAALDRMKDELVQLNQEKTKLLQKYKPNARFVVEVEERIQNLKRAISEETANPPQERSFALNDLRRRLESDLSNAQISLAGLRSRERDLTSQVGLQRIEAVRLNSKGIERTRLERERKINEEAFLIYQKKARENEVGQLLNRQQTLNFNVVDPPRTDGEQKSPKLLLNLLVLIALGAFAGLGSAIAADRFSPREDHDQHFPMRRVNPIYDLPLLADETQADSRQRQSANTALAPRGIFVEDPNDEKLREILRYFDGNK